MQVVILFGLGYNRRGEQIQDGQIKMFLAVPLKELDDPKKKARDVSGIGHWGTGDTQIVLNSLEDLEYVMSLIRQSYERTL